MGPEIAKKGGYRLFCCPQEDPVDKRVVSKRVVLADVPRNENRNEGTFGCSPGTKTGTRVCSPKPPFYETALLSPGEITMIVVFLVWQGPWGGPAWDASFLTRAHCNGKSATQMLVWGHLPLREGHIEHQWLFGPSTCVCRFQDAHGLSGSGGLGPPIALYPIASRDGTTFPTLTARAPLIEVVEIHALN